MTILPRCPICRKDVERRPANPAFPFCSERCRLIDLGAWMDELYRVPAQPDLEDDELPDVPPGARGPGRLPDA